MQTFLISSNNSDFIEKEIKQIQKNLDVSLVNLIEINPATSVSISDVRKILQTVSLKPYGGGERLIIINDIEKATPEASNALLKILEEPPVGNFFILITNNVNKLLPTIVSRCQIITDNHNTNNKTMDTGKSVKLLREILQSSAGERILLAQKVGNSREESIQLLEELIVSLEKFLHKPDEEIKLTPLETAELITKVTTAKNYLERYINFKATLDILFLGFPKKN
ncbi:hypothetical protein HY029_04935 [Candidatus Gottesmanbacteria bacterium]|nr:hypothetical protein [Candidatus Gottesmanbacteria bacterium]